MTEHNRANDVEMGKLIQAVATLTEEVTTLRTEMAAMTAKVNTGKGMFYGALFAAGGVGAGAAQIFDKLFP